MSALPDDAALAALVSILADGLQGRGLKLATAESCTGGWVAKCCTDRAGSSGWFERGFVTYSDEAKHDLLGVDAQVLQFAGAVSEAVVLQMASGAVSHSSADVSLAVTGIAGPDGGSEDKPVGTVWLAWGDRQAMRTRCLCWPVERTLFQTMIAAAGLDMIRRHLLGIEEEPRYFSQRRARQ